MLTYDTKRAFLAKWIYLGAFLTLAFVAFTHLDTILEVVRNKQMLSVGWTEQFIEESMTGKEMLFFLPVLCTLPYASAFIDEWKSGMTRLALGRVSRNRYLLSKVLVTAFSGGIILVAGMAAVVLGAYLVFFPLEDRTGLTQEILKAGNAYPQLFLRYFCFGALGALTGMWISMLVKNRYMALMGPFMAEYLLVILCERYFPWCRILYPAEWLTSAGAWPLSGWGTSLWMVCLAVFVGWAFFQTGKRRLSYV